MNPFDSDPDETEEESTQLAKSADTTKDISNVSSSGQSNKQLFKSDFEALSFSPSNGNQEITNNHSEILIQKAKVLIDKNETYSSNSEDINVKVKKIINARRKSSLAKAASINLGQSQEVEEYSLPKSFMERSSSIIGTEYVNQEIINFKNEQKELDEHAVYLENKLRSIMNNSEHKTEKVKDLEDRLLKEWFLLINRKNALLIRQQELEIIQNEKDLEKRYELLSDKLRDLISIEEFYKTEEEKTAESILLNELISNVMERNDLVLQMDEENKLLNEGELIDEYIQNKTSFQNNEKTCSIQ